MISGFFIKSEYSAMSLIVNDYRISHKKWIFSTATDSKLFHAPGFLTKTVIMLDIYFLNQCNIYEVAKVVHRNRSDNHCTRSNTQQCHRMLNLPGFKACNVNHCHLSEQQALLVRSHLFAELFWVVHLLYIYGATEHHQLPFLIWLATPQWNF